MGGGTERRHPATAVTGPHHHPDDDDHDPPEHDAPAAVALLTDEEAQKAVWRNDNVELTTVGIDIGSATAHLMFSYLHLQRQGRTFSSRFVVVGRKSLYRSPILLTPYKADGLIDTERIHEHIEAAYAAAGLTRSAVDAGAVILTGVALERANARGIAELFASEGGRFVCATAGHNLETLLAAHGSGAVARSREAGPVLNIDVGGGTTKLALAVDGKVVATLAISAGARLIELDPAGRLVRVEHGAAELAAELGIALRLGEPLDAATKRALADGLARRIVEATHGRAPAAIRLAGGLPPRPAPSLVVISGGVGELMATHGDAPYGDLGRELADALSARLSELPAPVAEGAERIRATVIGASQFSVQVSGNTVRLSPGHRLPLHNVPVIAVDLSEGAVDAGALERTIRQGAERLDLAESEGPVAIAVKWDGDPLYATLREIAGGIAAAHRGSPRQDGPVIVALTGDIAASLGGILSDELEMTSGVIAIDGLELADLDYLDIGEPILPANVVPVVVKSLVFPTPEIPLAPHILKEAR